MNCKSPLENEIEVTEGNIRMYILLVVMILVWGTMEAWRLNKDLSRPETIETQKNPEAVTPGHIHNN